MTHSVSRNVRTPGRTALDAIDKKEEGRRKCPNEKGRESTSDQMSTIPRCAQQSLVVSWSRGLVYLVVWYIWYPRYCVRQSILDKKIRHRVSTVYKCTGIKRKRLAVYSSAIVQY